MRITCPVALSVAREGSGFLPSWAVEGRVISNKHNGVNYRSIIAGGGDSFFRSWCPIGLSNVPKRFVMFQPVPPQGLVVTKQDLRTAHMAISNVLILTQINRASLKRFSYSRLKFFFLLVYWMIDISMNDRHWSCEAVLVKYIRYCLIGGNGF